MEVPAPPDAQDDSMSTDSNRNEPEAHYEEINVQDSNGTADLGDIVAVLDDEYEDEPNDVDTSIMKDYMKAIMKQYQTEESRECSGHTWLKDFLTILPCFRRYSSRFE